MEDILGMIKLFAGTYAPRNWAFCDGRLLSISQYTALFSILGNNYGGDGRVTFALPDLRGRVPLGAGLGINPRYPNLNVQIGEDGGTVSETLTLDSIPAHLHTGNVSALQVEAASSNPQNAMLAFSTIIVSGEIPTSNIYAPPSGTLVSMANNAITNILPAGAGLPHTNMQPYMGMNYIICMQGIFPQRP